MDCYLKDQDRFQLSSWLRKECHFKLLYKISQDGTSSQYLCDNKGPTDTVFYNTDNNVYVGYLSDSWRSTGAWFTDQRAFLFKLFSVTGYVTTRDPLWPSSITRTTTCTGVPVRQLGEYWGLVYRQIVVSVSVIKQQ